MKDSMSKDVAYLRNTESECNRFTTRGQRVQVAKGSSQKQEMYKKRKEYSSYYWGYCHFQDLSKTIIYATNCQLQL